MLTRGILVQPSRYVLVDRCRTTLLSHAFASVAHGSSLPPPPSLPACRFFEDYKKNEHKEVQVEEFHGAEMAKKIVVESLVRALCRPWLAYAARSYCTSWL